MPPPPKQPDLAHQSLLKSTKEFVELLRRGKIKIKPDIQHIENERVVFNDGTIMEKCEAIVLCTGYTTKFPFIDDPSLVPGVQEQRLDLYKRMLHPLYPTLAFVGYLEAIGAIFVLAEMQSRWISKVLKRTSLHSCLCHPWAHWSIMCRSLQKRLPCHHRRS